MTNVGGFIKQERERRGLSQEQLARILHIDRSTISRIETGTQLAAHDLLEKIVDALRSPQLRLELFGVAIPGMYLNNVDYHPLTEQHVVIQEMKEAIEELEKLNLINKIAPEDLTEEEKENMLHKVMMELQDVNACVQLTMMSYSVQYDIDLKELFDLWVDKMTDKGHHIEAVV